MRQQAPVVLQWDPGEADGGQRIGVKGMEVNEAESGLDGHDAEQVMVRMVRSSESAGATRRWMMTGRQRWNDRIKWQRKTNEQREGEQKERERSAREKDQRVSAKKTTGHVVTLEKGRCRQERRKEIKKQKKEIRKRCIARIRLNASLRRQAAVVLKPQCRGRSWRDERITQYALRNLQRQWHNIAKERDPQWMDTEERKEWDVQDWESYVLQQTPEIKKERAGRKKKGAARGVSKRHIQDRACATVAMTEERLALLVKDQRKWIVGGVGPGPSQPLVPNESPEEKHRRQDPEQRGDVDPPPSRLTADPTWRFGLNHWSEDAVRLEEYKRQHSFGNKDELASLQAGLIAAGWNRPKDVEETVKVLCTKSSRTTVVKVLGVEVSAGDIYRCRPRSSFSGDQSYWLSGNVMQAYSGILQVELQNQGKKVFVLDAAIGMALQMAGQGDYQTLLWHTRCMVWTEYNLIIGSVWIENHWVALRLEKGHAEVGIADPVSKSSSKLDTYLRLWQGLLNEQQGEGVWWKANWKIARVHSPVQDSSCDCGVFTLKALRAFGYGRAFTHSHATVQKDRVEIMMTVLHGRTHDMAGRVEEEIPDRWVKVFDDDWIENSDSEEKVLQAPPRTMMIDFPLISTTLFDQRRAARVHVLQGAGLKCTTNLLTWLCKSGADLLTCVHEAGCRIVPVGGDGNCLFRAVLVAMGQQEEGHLELRRKVVDAGLKNQMVPQMLYAPSPEDTARDGCYIPGLREGNLEYGVIPPETQRYNLARWADHMRTDKVYGGPIEVELLAVLLARPLIILHEVSVGGMADVSVHATSAGLGNPPIELWYRRSNQGSHYQAIGKSAAGGWTTVTGKPGKTRKKTGKEPEAQPASTIGQSMIMAGEKMSLNVQKAFASQNRHDSRGILFQDTAKNRVNSWPQERHDGTQDTSNAGDKGERGLIPKRPRDNWDPPDQVEGMQGSGKMVQRHEQEVLIPMVWEADIHLPACAACSRQKSVCFHSTVMGTAYRRRESIQKAREEKKAEGKMQVYGHPLRACPECRRKKGSCKLTVRQKIMNYYVQCLKDGTDLPACTRGTRWERPWETVACDAQLQAQKKRTKTEAGAGGATETDVPKESKAEKQGTETPPMTEKNSSKTGEAAAPQKVPTTEGVSLRAEPLPGKEETIAEKAMKEVTRVQEDLRQDGTKLKEEMMAYAERLGFPYSAVDAYMKAVCTQGNHEVHAIRSYTILATALIGARPLQSGGNRLTYWAHSSLIGAYLTMVLESVNGMEKVQLLPTEFGKALIAGTNVEPYTRCVEWSRRELVLAPISTDTHWVLLAVWPGARRIETRDSLGRLDQDTVDKVLQWLSFVDKQQGMTGAAWEVLYVDSPRQSNGCDCGYHVAASAEAMITGTEREMDMNKVRVKVALSVTTAKLGGRGKIYTGPTSGPGPQMRWRYPPVGIQDPITRARANRTIPAGEVYELLSQGTSSQVTGESRTMQEVDETRSRWKVTPHRQPTIEGDGVLIDVMKDHGAVTIARRTGECPAADVDERRAVSGKAHEESKKSGENGQDSGQWSGGCTCHQEFHTLEEQWIGGKRMTGTSYGIKEMIEEKGGPDPNITRKVLPARESRILRKRVDYRGEQIDEDGFRIEDTRYMKSGAHIRHIGMKAHTWVGIGPSTLEGANDGLFARKEIYKDQLMCLYLGKEFTVAGMQEGHEIAEKHGSAAAHQVRDKLILGHKSSYGRFVNDAKVRVTHEGDAEAGINCKIVYRQEWGAFAIQALRRIPVGGELLTSYTADYWRRFLPAATMDIGMAILTGYPTLRGSAEEREWIRRCKGQKASRKFHMGRQSTDTSSDDESDDTLHTGEEQEDENNPQGKADGGNEADARSEGGTERVQDGLVKDGEDEDTGWEDVSAGPDELIYTEGTCTCTGCRGKEQATWGVMWLNVNGLTETKLQLIVQRMVEARIMVAALADVRLNVGGIKGIKVLGQRLMGQGSHVLASPAQEGRSVGGMIWLLMRGAGHTTRIAWDATGLGLGGMIELGHSPRLRLIQTYWPVAAVTAGSLEAKATEWMKNNRVTGKVIELVREKLLRWQMSGLLSGTRCLIGGDFNADMDGTGTYNDLAEWARGCGLERVHMEGNDMTRYSGNRVSRLDHIFGSTGDAPRDGAVLRCLGLSEVSDHRAVSCFWPTPKTLPNPCEISRVQELGATSLKTTKQKTQFGDALALAYTSLQDHDKKDADAICSLSVKVAEKMCRRTRLTKDGWSPEMVIRRIKLSALTQIYHTYRLKLGARATDKAILSILKRWEKAIVVVGNTKCRRRALAKRIKADEFGIRRWALGGSSLLREQVVRQEISQARRSLQSRERSLLRERIGGHISRIQRQYEVGKLRPVIQKMTGQTKEHFEMLHLESGEDEVTFDAYEIHEKMTDGLTAPEAHLGGLLQKGSGLPHTWEAFRAAHATLAIPENMIGSHLRKVWEVLSTSPTQLDQVDSKGTSMRQVMKDDLLKPITFEEFTGEISRKPTASAGGPSRLTYGQIKLWPVKILEAVHASLTESWMKCTVPASWKYTWIVPIPKVPGSAKIKEMRPLVLAEVMRKIWIGALNRRIVHWMEKLKLLSPAQHAWRRKGTETALGEVLNVIEQARAKREDLYFSSFDISNAFPSVHYGIQEIAWLRLGVPNELLYLLVGMDGEGLGIVRSPAAVRQWKARGGGGFSSTKVDGKMKGICPQGGIGQGLPEAPMGWLAVFDIALRCLETDDGKPVWTTDSTGQVVAAKPIGYVDDLLTPESTIEDLRERANQFSVVALVLGLRLNTSKMRVYHMKNKESVTQTETITVWLTEGPLEVEVKTSGQLKILGFKIPISNEDSKSLLTEVIQMVTRTVRAVRARRAKGAIKIMAISLSTMEKAKYIGAHSSWSLDEIKRLEKCFECLYRGALKLPHGFPTELLYGEYGLQLKRISVQLGEMKERMLQRIMIHPEYAGLANSLLHNAAEDQDGPQPLGASWRHTKGGDITRGWASLLLAQAERLGVTAATGGMKGQGMNESLIEVIDAAPMTKKCKDNMRMNAKEKGIAVMGDLVLEDGSWRADKTFTSLLQGRTCLAGPLQIRKGQLWALQDGCLPDLMEIKGMHGKRIWGRIWQHSGEEQDKWYECKESDHEGTGEAHLYDESLLFEGHDIRQGFLGSLHMRGSLGEGLIRSSCYNRHLQGIVAREKPIRGVKAQTELEELISEVATTETTAITSDGSWTEVPNAEDVVTARRHMRSSTGIVGQGIDGRVLWALHINLTHMELRCANEAEMVGQFIALQAADIVKKKQEQGGSVSRPISIRSDCQGAIKILNNVWGWRKRGIDPMFPLLSTLNEQGLTATPIEWVQGHPEKRAHYSSWTREEWGIGMADRAADMINGNGFQTRLRECMALFDLPALEEWHQHIQAALREIRKESTPGPVRNMRRSGRDRRRADIYGGGEIYQGPAENFAQGQDEQAKEGTIPRLRRVAFPPAKGRVWDANLHGKHTAVWEITKDVLDSHLQQRSRFHYVDKNERVITLGLRSIRSEKEAEAYVLRRDEYRAQRGESPLWEGLTYWTAIKAKGRQKSVEAAKRKVMWIWDKIVHGRNIAKGQQGRPNNGCPLCSALIDDQAHICWCPHPVVAKARERGLARIMTRLTSPTPLKKKTKKGAPSKPRPMPENLRRWAHHLMAVVRRAPNAAEPQQSCELWSGMVAPPLRKALEEWLVANLDSGSHKKAAKILTALIDQLQDLGHNLYVVRCQERRNGGQAQDKEKKEETQSQSPSLVVTPSPLRALTQRSLDSYWHKKGTEVRDEMDPPLQRLRRPKIEISQESMQTTQIKEFCTGSRWGVPASEHPLDNFDVG